MCRTIAATEATMSFVVGFLIGVGLAYGVKVYSDRKAKQKKQGGSAPTGKW